MVNEPRNRTVKLSEDTETNFFVIRRKSLGHQIPCFSFAPHQLFIVQLDPSLSPTRGDQQEAQPRLFDEFNDDGDDEGEFAYGAVGGGKSDNLKVILVAPTRSPAIPPAAAGCCGGPTTNTLDSPKNEITAGAGVEGGDGGTTVANTPAPVLTGGWAGAGASGSYWQVRGHSADKKWEEDGGAVEEGEGQGLLDEGQTVRSGTEVFRSCVYVCVQMRVLLCGLTDGRGQK